LGRFQFSALFCDVRFGLPQKKLKTINGIVKLSVKWIFSFIDFTRDILMGNFGF
jgi:hypothetical protein